MRFSRSPRSRRWCTAPRSDGSVYLSESVTLTRRHAGSSRQRFPEINSRQRLPNAFCQPIILGYETANCFQAVNELGFARPLETGEFCQQEDKISSRLDGKQRHGSVRLTSAGEFFPGSVTVRFVQIFWQNQNGNAKETFEERDVRRF